MERARFFYLLRIARIFKEAGDTKIERWVRLFWIRSAYTDGWWANKLGR